VIEEDRVSATRTRPAARSCRRCSSSTGSSTACCRTRHVLEFEVADAQRADYMFKLNNPDVEPVDERADRLRHLDPDHHLLAVQRRVLADELGYYRYTEQGACK
jgi:hypothetical protein